MEKVITYPLGEPAHAITEGLSAPSRSRLPRWLLVVGFWTLIVLAYSTRTEIRCGHLRLGADHVVRVAQDRGLAVVRVGPAVGRHLLGQPQACRLRATRCCGACWSTSR